MLYFVPDTNVLLHARRLSECPWGELDANEVQILIVGPTIREIDKYKIRGGRIGRRAKAVNTEIRDVISAPDRAKLLSEAGPRVTLKIVPGVGVHDKHHPCLDLSNADHELVNHCLVQIALGIPVKLLTNDTGALLVAEEAGVEAVLLPDNCKREFRRTCSASAACYGLSLW